MRQINKELNGAIERLTAPHLTVEQLLFSARYESHLVRTALGLCAIYLHRGYSVFQLEEDIRFSSAIASACGHAAFQRGMH